MPKQNKQDVLYTVQLPEKGCFKCKSSRFNSYGMPTCDLLESGNEVDFVGICNLYEEQANGLNPTHD